MAKLLVSADTALVEATFCCALPSKRTPLNDSAVRSAGRRVVANRAVAGVVA